MDKLEIQSCDHETESRLGGRVSDALARSRNTPSYNSNDGFGRVAGEQLNFAAPSEDEAEYPPGAYLKKGKVSRQDPMSHRIIEKRRRDRMNNCLADLSRLIPPEYLKKGRGRVEKTEIIEMAIRHLKYLQERANAADRGLGEEHFRAGYQDAVAEVMRFLVEVHGYGPGDGLCVQLAAHMQRHCEALAKGEPLPRDKPRSHPGSSSETASSSSSSHGYTMKPGVIAQAPPPAPPPFAPEPYEERPQEHPYSMECDRVSVAPTPMAGEGEGLPESEPLPLDGRRKRGEPTLRAVRKPDHTEDYLHSYKFKNSIERRFSRSQDTEAADMLARTAHAHGKVYSHKRRRATKPAPSTSTSNSGSTEDARDTSPQDTSSESPHHHHYDKPPPPAQYVPVFALNALGKYYVPLSVDYACLQRHLGPYDVLDARAVHLAAPLHPVTIHVNFQPCLNYHVKREPNERDQWRAV
ncbi:transcription factor cwo isoform X3 [Spodoptera frugiperda]|uniref:Transcription factor cwo isoform X3 n=1 Tax=Spodoptera frugiperda TaxID=7108 RepID=A0A9R0F268_SPOFR|nr:transcription factor cwo isoform X3 [Spodoptera frugiperda]